MSSLDAVKCPFCEAYMTRETLQFLEERSRGWSNRAHSLLLSRGFSKAAIELAQQTGIVSGWLESQDNPFVPKYLTLSDNAEYCVECLACGIGYNHQVAVFQLEHARGDLRRWTEERVQYEFRLLAADSGCQHWSAYKKLKIETDISQTANSNS